MTTDDYKKAAADLEMYADAFETARTGGKAGRALALVQISLHFMPKDKAAEKALAIMRMAVNLAKSWTKPFVDFRISTEQAALQMAQLRELSMKMKNQERPHFPPGGILIHQGNTAPDEPQGLKFPQRRYHLGACDYEFCDKCNPPKRKPMKKLQLTLKKQWFDMMKSGEKREEYREIKPYWATRLLKPEALDKKLQEITPHDFKDFDLVEYVNGYGKDKPRLLYAVKSMRVGYGNPSLGAEPGKLYFIITNGAEI